MSTKVKGKRLKESERLEIISKLSKPNPPSKRSIARDYGVGESSIRKLWTKKDEVLQRSSVLTEKANPRGKGKRLRESERLEIISKLSKPNPPSKRSIARDYGVGESTIRKLWTKKDEVIQRSSEMTEEAKQNSFRATAPKFPQMEDILYQWIIAMRCSNVALPPSLVIAKAREIAVELGISEDEFKGSWKWLYRFRKRRGITAGDMLPQQQSALDQPVSNDHP